MKRSFLCVLFYDNLVVKSNNNKDTNNLRVFNGKAFSLLVNNSCKHIASPKDTIFFSNKIKRIINEFFVTSVRFLF